MFKKFRKWFGAIFLLIIALAIAFSGYKVILHNQPLILPSPTGSYTIGRIEYDWIDNNRIDPLSEKSYQKRELLIWVWYPAVETGSQAPFLPPA